LAVVMGPERTFSHWIPPAFESESVIDCILEVVY
jgi:hypothetical protein